MQLINWTSRQTPRVLGWKRCRKPISQEASAWRGKTWANVRLKTPSATYKAEQGYAITSTLRGMGSHPGASTLSPALPFAAEPEVSETLGPHLRRARPSGLLPPPDLVTDFICQVHT